MLQALKTKGLSHNDLHEKNILVRPESDALRGEETVRLVVIDSGQLKTEERRLELLDRWREQLATLEPVFDGKTVSVANAIDGCRKRLEYFGRTDQEWVVYHFCTLFNCMRRNLPSADPVTKRFIRDLPKSLRAMVDTDPSRRLDDPAQMHNEVERVWAAVNTTTEIVDGVAVRSAFCGVDSERPRVDGPFLGHVSSARRVPQ